MKICTRCNINQNDECFYIIKNGKSLHSKCKTCCQILNKENQVKRNKDNKKEYNKKYYSEFKSDISLQNRQQKNMYQREYYQLNKDVIFEKEKERYHNDIQFRLSKIYRNRLNSYIKGEKELVKYLNCNLIELKNFIEIQFEKDMFWDNRNNIWELDHVIPVSKFNLEIPLHKEVCFHWSNLKPIYTSINKQKSNKFFKNYIKTHSEFCSNYSLTHNLHYIDIYKFFNQDILRNK